MAKEAPDAGLISILWKIFNLCKGRWLTLLVKFPSNFAGLAGVSPSVLPSVIDLERCNIKTLGRSRSLLLLILTVTLINVLSNNYWVLAILLTWGGGPLPSSLHFCPNLHTWDVPSLGYAIIEIRTIKRHLYVSHSRMLTPNMRRGLIIYTIAMSSALFNLVHFP